MVDKLKRSVQDLEAPVCPSCKVEAAWFASELVNGTPPTIRHNFACPKCRRSFTAYTKATSIDPDFTGKLSKPARRVDVRAA